MRSAAVVIVALLAGACGQDGNPGACELGTTVPCTCQTGASGTRSCEDDGSFSACMCEPVDAGIDAAESDAAPAAACNPLAPSGQQGCTGGQKCGWVQTQDAPDVRGVYACVPDGITPRGAACERSATGDDCAAGDICVGGTCKAICEIGAPTGCGASTRCTPYASVLVDAQGTSTHGVCETGCDPITQLTFSGDACPTNQACYPLVVADTTVAVCANAGTAVYRQVISPPFANSCIPGFYPRRRPGSATQECGPLCQPAEVTSTVNAPLEGGVAPHSCAAKGAPVPSDAAAGESCRFWYGREPFAATSPFSNALGYCIDHVATQYDSTGDMIDDAPLPRCITVTHADTIPPIGTAPTDDAVFFRCAPKPAMATGTPKQPPLNVETPSRLTDRSL